MATWQKVITSGSVAVLAEVTASVGFSGDGSGLSGISADSLANNLTVDNATIQLNSGTTFNGSAARTISVKDGGIDTDALGADAVTGAKIADNAINSEHYTDGSIDTAHIADLQVTTGKIAADAITAAKLADDAVVTANITNLNVTTGKIAADAITGAKIADNAINSEHYTDASIDTAHIADSQVTNAKLANDGITIAGVDTDLGGSITQAVILNGSGVFSGSAQVSLSNLTVDNATIQLNSGTTYNGSGAKTISIKDGGVDTDALGADAVTGAKIADNAINSEHYTDASIDTAHIADLQVTTGKIAADAVTAAKLADNAVVTANITDLNVTTGKIAADAITGAKIADNAIDSEHYTDGSIDADHIASNAVTTAKINADAVTGAKIADNAINSEHYTDGSIDTAHIANDAVTGDKLANDITIANDLTVTGDLLVSGDTITVNTANLAVEDQFILLNSGSNSKDVGIIFGGTTGTDNTGKALIWDYSYNSNDGRAAISTTAVAANNTTNFGASTAGYYVAGVFEGSATNAATAKADHNGNIRIESNEIYIYA